MKRSVFWALVRKDLYLMRGLIFLMVVIGMVSFVVTRFGNIGLAVGGLIFLTANIAGGIFMAMGMLIGERKEMARAFALSLPISGRGYDRAKLTAGYIAYVIPWTIVTAWVLWGFLRPGSDADRGMVVYAIVLQGFALAMYSVLLAALFGVTTDGMGALIIIGSNILFSLFMMKLNQPEIAGPLRTGQIVWTSFAQRMLVGEVIAIALSAGIALFAMSRRRDYV